MPLDTIKAIHTRFSCRGFTDRVPPDEDLKTIAEAAIAAPSGMDRQLWRVIVVKNKELIGDLEAEGIKNLKAFPEVYSHIMSRGGALFYNAPCMAVIPIGKVEPPGAELFDCGIIAENIALAATSIGIDNLICGMTAFSFAGERNDEFKRRLGFPEGFEIGLAVLLGYAADADGKPHDLDYGKISYVE
jgi:nitroreductase